MYGCIACQTIIKIIYKIYLGNIPHFSVTNFTLLIWICLQEFTYKLFIYGLQGFTDLVYY